jgi:predicted lipoprotein with Yx(FWY)xxD motif
MNIKSPIGSHPSPRYPVHRVVGRRRGWLLAGMALIATACSSSTGSGTSPSPASSAPPAASSAPSAAAASHGGDVLRVGSTGVGQILVDAAGKAVYVFAIDKPGHSVCTATCLQYWPIVTAPSPLPSTLPGVTAKLGVLKRPDGAAQLTVNDYPVYTFAGDSGPGTTKGQGKNLSGGLWWVIAPDGKWITSSGAGSSTGGASGSPSKGY